MKKLFVCLIMFIFIFVMYNTIYAENETDVNDNSVQYAVELGDGQGAILVFGDNNTIYMPPTMNEQEQINPNEITEADDRFNVVLTETDIINKEGASISFSRLVLTLNMDGTWDLLWAEEKD